MTTDYIAFDATQTATIIDFPAGTFELAQAKAHGLRALVGLLADRDSACQLGHPFCGPPPGPGAAEHWMLIAFATSQQDENTGAPIIALYLSAADQAARYAAEAADPIDQWEYTAGLVLRGNIPLRKVVVALVNDGTYLGQLGSIADPVEGDHSTGRLDRAALVSSLRLDPEPPHTKWQYYDGLPTAGQVVVPEFHCALLGDDWWIVDVDRQKGAARAAAALAFADRPGHGAEGYHLQRPGEGNTP